MDQNGYRNFCVRHVNSFTDRKQKGAEGSLCVATFHTVFAPRCALSVAIRMAKSTRKPRPLWRR
jgi:hypothetical protein